MPTVPPIRSPQRRPTPVTLLAAILLTVVCLAIPAFAQEGSGPSGVLDDGSRRLEWQIGGVEVGDHSYSGSDRCWTAPGTVTSTTVTFSGLVRAEVPSGMVTTASMSAYLLNTTTGEKHEVLWPDTTKGEVGDLGAPNELSHELPFDFAVQVSPGDTVWATANVSSCGGVCDVLSLCLFFDPAPADIAAAPTAAPTPAATPTATPMPTAAATPEPEEPPSWVGTVVGVGLAGMLLVAGAAVAVALAIRARGRKAREAARYVLQVSAQRIDLQPGVSQMLTVTAWRVTPEGGYAAAPEASLKVQRPPVDWLQVTPTAGQGSMQCRLSIQEDVDEAEVALTVDGLASGAKVSATVLVRAATPYEIVVH